MQWTDPVVNTASASMADEWYRRAMVFVSKRAAREYCREQGLKCYVSRVRVGAALKFSQWIIKDGVGRVLVEMAQ